jgi:L-lyxonate dehydratase
MTAPITAIRTYVVPSRDTPPPAKGIGRPVITPVTELSRGDEYLRGPSTSGLTPGPTLMVVVVVEDGEGRSGVGTAGFGHIATVGVIEQLARIALGCAPTDVEWLWAMMYRSTVNVGRRGVVLHAISAIDIAVWDLLARQLEQPLYNLLGGRVRPAIDAYASRLYATEDLDSLAEEAASWVAAGFRGVKQRLAYGPRDGKWGICKNIELLQTVANAIGNEVDHMADAYMGWDVPYAIRCLHSIEDAGVRLRWIEEPIMPDDIRGLAAIRSAVSTPIAAGEHEATRWGFRDLITAEAVDVLQPDVNRLGGITEARRVWALGETFGNEVIAHVGAAHNLHLSITSHATPYIEYIPPPQRMGESDEDQVFWELFPDEPRAKNGKVTPTGGHGLGVTLNAALVVPVSVVEEGR